MRQDDPPAPTVLPVEATEQIALALRKSEERFRQVVESAPERDGDDQPDAA